mmetsp:Transcript_43461/g.120801  ORF Transcript_43461/g.120801 Transcript_43461/m.120801 type:complete len:276 (-) Transcript_43461:103-930(-)
MLSSVDAGSDVVKDAVMVRFRPAAGPLVRHGQRRRGAADERAPQAGHAACRYIPVAHGHSARVCCGTAHVLNDVLAGVDTRVRRMNRHDAKARAAAHWRGRLHAGNREGARVVVGAQATAAALLHLPARGEGQGGGVPALAHVARPVDLLPPREAVLRNLGGLARAVGQLDGGHNVRVRLLGQLGKALTDPLLAVPGGAPRCRAAFPVDIPEKRRQLHRSAWQQGRRLQLVVDLQPTTAPNLQQHVVIAHPRSTDFVSCLASERRRSRNTTKERP